MLSSPTHQTPLLREDPPLATQHSGPDHLLTAPGHELWRYRTELCVHRESSGERAQWEVSRLESQAQEE